MPQREAWYLLGGVEVLLSKAGWASVAGSNEVSDTQAATGSGRSWERLLPTVGSGVWRRVVAWFFLILGCLLVPLAVMGVWLRVAVFDTEGFVDTLAPLASEQAVQETVADVLSAKIIEAIDLEAQLRQVLPNQVGFLAEVAAEQLNDWVRSQTEAVIASDEFAALWTNALRFSHGTISGVLRGESAVVLGPGDVIQLDLSPVTSRVVDRLEGAGISLSSDIRDDLLDSKVSLIEVEGLSKMTGILNTLNRVSILLPILAVLCLAGALIVAERRQKEVARMGAGLMISMAVFIVVLALAQVGLVNLITQAGPSTLTGEALWSTLTIAMRGTAWGLFALGLVLFASPRIVGALQGQRISEAAGRAAGSGWTTGRPASWIASHRTALAVVVLALGVLTLVLWRGPGWVAILTIALIVVLLEAAVVFVAKAHDIAIKGASAVATETDAETEAAKS